MSKNRPYSLLIPSVIIFSVLFLNNKIQAQIIADEAPKDKYYMRKMRVTNFWEMKDFRDVFHVDKYYLGRNRFSGNFAYNWGRVLVGPATNREAHYRSALSYFMRWRFYEELSINATFYYDFNKLASQRWISDFTYSIGRYHWRPNKLNFGYENYQNNKYTDDAATLIQKATEGYLFLSYNVALPDALARAIRIDSTSSLRVSPLVRYAARYRGTELEMRDGELRERVYSDGKPTAGITARWTMFWNIYIEGGAYYYFQDMGFVQLPWDPDYSYGFGYFDYRSFRLSLTYGNWAVNRWPGKARSIKDYGFMDGTFRLVANWQW